MMRAHPVTIDAIPPVRHAFRGGLLMAAWIIFFALALASATAPAQPRQVIVLDRIVAVVNDEVITRIDLDERVRVTSAQLKQQGAPLPPRDTLDRRVLDRLILDRVQLQLAK